MVIKKKYIYINKNINSDNHQWPCFIDTNIPNPLACRTIERTFIFYFYIRLTMVYIIKSNQKTCTLN